MSYPAVDHARRLTLGAQLARHARLTPDAPAFVLSGTRRSFGEMDSRVDQLAGALSQRGVRAGDRVAVLMTNKLEQVESFLAIVRLGAICLPVNFRLAPPEVEYILADSGAKVLLVDEPSLPLVTDAVIRSAGLSSVIAAANPERAGALGFESYEKALRDASAPPIVDVLDEAPAFLMYTSGTTGRPKGALLTHQNLNVNTINMIVSLEIAPTDRRWLAGLPLFHIGGLNGILPFLFLGGVSYILPSGQFDAGLVRDLLISEQITSCYFVPTQWQAICELPDIRGRVSTLERVTWGASVSPPSVLTAIAETFPGVRLYNVFGQTEMSSITTAMRADKNLERMSSVGKPVLNVEVRVVDNDMNDVKPGAVGEIVYRGPTVMQGYWNKPEATAEAFEGGWFHSGDLVHADEEGFLFVVDRKKDMIISGGENIYCTEVEAAIDVHPAVREVAVIGVPHPRWVETPVAVISLHDGASLTEAEVVEWCRARLASYKKPSRVIFVAQLPRNATGKVLKRELREQYAQPLAATG
jgi:fatty-acyl-CoA synthase